MGAGAAPVLSPVLSPCYYPLSLLLRGRTGFRCSRSVVDKKGFRKKFFRLAAAGYGGAGFQLVHKFL